MTDTWTWATVTQATPLRIKVDGDTTALDATTDNLVGSLAVDDRVRVHLHSDGIIVTGIQGGGNRSNPNLLINSNFMVNQEGNTSGASVASGGYFLDGWLNPGGPSTLITWADTGGVRTITIGGGGAGYAQQKVEATTLPAGTYTVSWEGTAKLYIWVLNPAYETSPVTFTTDGTADVKFQFRGYGDTLRNAKLEQGSVATPYQPPTYADNLRACMRYFQVLISSTQNGDEYGYQDAFYQTSTIVYMPIKLRVMMRAEPTIVSSVGTGHFSIVSAGERDFMNSLSRGAGGSAGQVSLTNSADVSGTAGNAGMLRSEVSTAYVYADARL